MPFVEMSIRNFLTPKSPRRKVSPEAFDGPQPAQTSQSSGKLPVLTRAPSLPSGNTVEPQPPRSPRAVLQQSQGASLCVFFFSLSCSDKLHRRFQRLCSAAVFVAASAAASEEALARHSA